MARGAAIARAQPERITVARMANTGGTMMRCAARSASGRTSRRRRRWRLLRGETGVAQATTASAATILDARTRGMEES